MPMTIDTSKGRTQDFNDMTERISAYIKALPLSSKQNDTMVILLAKHLCTAEENAFKYAMEISASIMDSYTKKKGFEPPNETEYKELIAKAVEFIDLKTKWMQLGKDTLNKKLIPCPFCGKEPHIEVIEPHTHSGWLKTQIPDLPDCEGEAFVICENCSAAISGKTETEVIEKWNHRANLTELPYGPEDEE